MLWLRHNNPKTNQSIADFEMTVLRHTLFNCLIDFVSDDFFLTFLSLNELKNENRFMKQTYHKKVNQH